MSGAYRLRIAVREDEPSIYSDWLKSARKARTFHGVTSQVFYFWMHAIIETLLDDASVTWLVACASDDPTKIYGWLCGHRATTLAGDQSVVHYVYVKKLYRRVGIATNLLERFVGDAAIVASSMSEAGRELIGDRIYLFNPFLLFARTPTTIAPRRRALPGFVPGDTDGSQEVDDA